MFDIHTAQQGDQVLVEIKGQEVTGVIDKIQPHTINWNVYQVFVTTDKPVKVWSDSDIRDGFCIWHDTSNSESDRVTRILA